MSQIEKLLIKFQRTKTAVSFVDLRTLLAHFGYTEARQRGSHVHFRRVNSPSLTIPVHNGKVKIVYVKDILKLFDL